MIIIDRPLPATKTWAARRYHYVSPAPAVSCLGRVDFYQRKKIDKPDDLDVYFLDEFRDESLPPGFRSFFFARQTGEFTEKAGGLYQVDVSPAGLVVRCTCTGSETQHHKGPCKHKDTMTDLIAVGVFTPADAALAAGEVRQ